MSKIAIRFGFIASVLTLATQTATAQQSASDSIAAAHDAIAADDYAKAQSLLAKAAAAAKRDPATQAEIAELRRDAGRLQKKFAKLTKARDTLKGSPSDPTANDEIGAFYAFAKGDWDRGLPLLARGSDDTIQAAATLDLKKPEQPQGRVELGDRWRQVAESSRDESAVSRATLRARHWYLLAAESLADEADRKPIYDRLDRLRLYPDKVVIVNTHNGHYNDRGALLVDLKLLLDGKVVLTRRVPMPWRKGAAIPMTVRLPRTQADAVQVDVLKWQGLGGALAEIEVYQGGVNIARDAPAEASGEHDEPYRATNVTDGDYGGEFEQGGIWVLPDSEAGWVRVSLDRP